MSFLLLPAGRSETVLKWDVRTCGVIALRDIAIAIWVSALDEYIKSAKYCSVTIRLLQLVLHSHQLSSFPVYLGLMPGQPRHPQIKVEFFSQIEKDKLVVSFQTIEYKSQSNDLICKHNHESSATLTITISSIGWFCSTIWDNLLLEENCSRHQGQPKHIVERGLHQHSIE